MESVTGKLVLAGVLFVLTLISGVILSRLGRPLSMGLSTIHKLISIASVVFIAIAAFQLLKSADGKTGIEIVLMIVSGILFLALIATGALLTREDMQLPMIVLRIHQIAPLLSLILSVITVFLLSKAQS